MKGWLFTKTHVAPKLIEKEDPKAVPGEVVVDIKACGLCHTDVGMLENEYYMNLAKAAPCIFGHECAGVVSEVGEGVTKFKVGDRVGVVPQNPENPLDVIGFTRDGGYATKILVPEAWICPLPDEVSFIQGAAGTDAGATAHHAVFAIGEAKAGMRIGIIGIGGLGQFAAQMAIIEGCEVYAADTSADARALAEEIGCKKVYSDVKDFANDNLELIIDFAGYDATVSAAADVLAPKGTLVVVGCGADGSKVSITHSNFITREIKVKGSCGNVYSDVAGVYKFFKTGKLNPILHTIPFEEVDKGLERLHKGGFRGRLVMVNE